MGLSLFVLIFIFIYLLLGNDRSKIVAIIIGSSLVNVLLLYMPSSKENEVAIIGMQNADKADPIPQALVLTAIVISLAFIILYIKLKQKEFSIERST